MARRADLWVLSIATLLLLLTAIVVWGWVRVPGEPWRTFPPPAARSDTGVELRVMLRRDTISSRDRSPVEVLYSIVNGPGRTEFDNGPERFAFRVERPDGRLVQPAYWSHRVTATLGPQVHMVLTAGAVLAQAQDLRCVSDGAYSQVPQTRAPDCLVMWDFAAPGTYRVIVKYFGRDDWGNIDSLLAATGKMDVDAAPRAQGQRLADTATLVVRR